MTYEAIKYRFIDQPNQIIDQADNKKFDLKSNRKQLAAYRGGDFILSVSQLLLTSLSFMTFLSVALVNYEQAFGISLISIVLTEIVPRSDRNA